MAEKAIAKKDLGTQVVERIESLCQTGMTFSKDYNYVNAIKASVLALQEIKNKQGKTVMECCTASSIQTALFEMATRSLDVSKKQGYFIIYGNTLKFQTSYFGHILQVKRLFPNWSPVANTIRKDDVFIYNIDSETGKKKLVKHEQKLENLDNDFIGAYMYLPCADGTQELYVMTKKQILAAWSKSSNANLTTHKQFDEKMALKTIINSGCQKVINSTPDTNSTPLDDDNVVDPIAEGKESEPFVDFEESVEDVTPTQEETPAEPEKTETTEEKPQDDDEF